MAVWLFGCLAVWEPRSGAGRPGQAPEGHAVGLGGAARVGGSERDRQAAPAAVSVWGAKPRPPSGSAGTRVGLVGLGL